MDRTILAISGGGFSEEDQAYIDEYLLKIPRKQEPLKIAFIATASNDAQGYIDKFYKAFKNEQSSHLTINDFDTPHIQEIVNDLDIVYVGGGNTQYMLRRCVKKCLSKRCRISRYKCRVHVLVWNLF
ncbi:hypothetical protein BCV73_24515 [Paenibacillus sp. SSG-1]|nr:hypothetical protein BCV73_24515 [Paenibacillus sp. SSG-1]